MAKELEKYCEPCSADFSLPFNIWGVARSAQSVNVATSCWYILRNTSVVELGSLGPIVRMGFFEQWDINGDNLNDSP